MNNREFITALSQKTQYKAEDTQTITRTVVNSIINALTAGEQVNVKGLGSFDVKKRMERIITNPGNGQKMLVPPKLVTSFKPANELKERMREIENKESAESADNPDKL